MESDVDSVPWRDELTTEVPEIENGLDDHPNQTRLGAATWTKTPPANTLGGDERPGAEPLHASDWH